MQAWINGADGTHHRACASSTAHSTERAVSAVPRTTWRHACSAAQRSAWAGSACIRVRAVPTQRAAAPTLDQFTATVLVDVFADEPASAPLRLVVQVGAPIANSTLHAVLHTVRGALRVALRSLRLRFGHSARERLALSAVVLRIGALPLTTSYCEDRPLSARERLARDECDSVAAARQAAEREAAVQAARPRGLGLVLRAGLAA